jgi:MFS family permease
MRALRIGVLTPLLLLCAAFGSWSLSSLCFLIAFFIFQYKCHRQDWRGHRHRPWKGLIFLAGSVLITEGAVGLTCAVLKLDKHILEKQWMKILGFSRLDPWELDLRAIFSLLPQLGVLLTALYASHQGQYISLYNCQHSLYGTYILSFVLAFDFGWYKPNVLFLIPVVDKCCVDRDGVSGD